MASVVGTAILIHFAGYLVPSVALELLAGALTLVAVIGLAPARYRPGIGLLIALSLALYLRTGGGVGEFVAEAGKALDLAAAILAVQTLQWPLRHLGYDKTLREFLRGWLAGSRRRLYGHQGFALGLSSVLGFAGVPLAYLLSNPSLASHEWTAKAVSRGYLLAILWTPLSVGSALVLKLTGATWFDTLPIALGTMVVALLVFTLLDRPSIGDLAHTGRRGATWEGVAPEDDTSEGAKPEGLRPMLPLILGLLLFAAALLTLEAVLPLSPLDVLALVTVAVSALWLTTAGKSRDLRYLAREFVRESIPASGELLAVMLSTAVLVEAGTASGLLLRLLDPVLTAAGTAGYLGLALTICLAPVVLGFFGVDPFVSLLALGTSLAATDLGMEPGTMAVLLLGGAGLANVLSPLSLNSVTLSRLTGLPPLQFARWNLGFSATVLGVLVLIASVHTSLF